MTVKRAFSTALLGLLMTTGCAVTFSGHADTDGKTPHAKAPVDKDGVEVWDLRTPPSTSDVGMRSDKNYVAYESRKPRRVRFLLPENRELRIDASLVVFDRVMYKDPADPTRPTGMDFRMKPIPLDQAYKVMGRSLKAFGLDTAQVDQWRQDIENRPSSGVESNLRVEGGGNTTIGYLDIGVGGVYNPIGGDNLATIKYHANFYGH